MRGYQELLTSSAVRQSGNVLSCRDRLGILLVLGAAATSGRDRKVTYVANFVSGVTIDCVDPQRVACFWSALLGREPGPSQAGWVYLGHRGDPQPRLVFQPVPEPKAGKVRIHLDVTVDDVDDAIELVTSLGGRTTERERPSPSGSDGTQTGTERGGNMRLSWSADGG